MTTPVLRDIMDAAFTRYLDSSSYAPILAPSLYIREWKQRLRPTYVGPIVEQDRQCPADEPQH
jgi:hypothetical protein